MAITADLLASQVVDLKAGNEKALCFFMKVHSQALHFFTFKIVKDNQIATEIVSDAFVKLWEKRTDMLQADAIKSFLYVVCKHKSIDFLKQSRNRLAHDDLHLEELEWKETDILTKIIYTELIELIAIEIERLPAQQAKIFELSFFEGKETHEICEELGTTASTVYFAKSKAISALKEAFQKKNISYYQIAFLLGSHPILYSILN
ncbi:sigma-70 family RNA polymerase sigma factor [Sphingobacterium sp. HJSM2_6]|uniref:sigma-70 family RNA polymerase sigma factor n=1 Tax=Sphingobacterium sp. HJSM2_6 TaxID=3366264 RepID=UPI003BC1798E